MQRHHATNQRHLAAIALLLLLLLTVTSGCGVAATLSTPSLAPTPTAIPTNPPSLLPLGVILTADATISGELGSYAMDGAGGDAPWPDVPTLPTLHVGPQDNITVALIDEAPIGDWSAVIAAADDSAGALTRAVPGTTLAVDHRVLHLGLLPTGRWVLNVRLIRADGRGDGSTFWAVTVP